MVFSKHAIGTTRFINIVHNLKKIHTMTLVLESGNEAPQTTAILLVKVNQWYCSVENSRLSNQGH